MEVEVTLTDEVQAVVKEIRRLAALPTNGDAISKALGSELFFQQHMAAGWRVIIERNGRYKEVEL